MPTVKTIDKMGRLVLGREYAGEAVMVREVEKGTFMVTIGKFIPERESWLYENPEALAMVRQGLKESAEGAMPSAAPDLDADALAFANEDGEE